MNSKIDQPEPNNENASFEYIKNLPVEDRLEMSKRPIKEYGEKVNLGKGHSYERLKQM